MTVMYAGRGLAHSLLAPAVARGHDTVKQKLLGGVSTSRGCAGSALAVCAHKGKFLRSLRCGCQAGENSQSVHLCPQAARVKRIKVHTHYGHTFETFQGGF